MALHLPELTFQVCDFDISTMPKRYANASIAHFLHSSMSGDASRLPQTIAHRGYKGHYPENTIYAIDKAIAAGTHALELDLHISRDGVIVLSHVSMLFRADL